ncbi:MAG TPA: 7TM diverse intracellular signaling domain-containing protein [Phaeodactylibacter sp.]|nr:7TM diverse intracellular signaling domain-containing protein [Phaeodactylibacter sp.]
MHHKRWIYALFFFTPLALHGQLDTVLIGHVGESYDRVITQNIQWLDTNASAERNWKALLEQAGTAFAYLQEDTVRLEAEQTHWGRVCVCNTAPAPYSLVLNTRKPERAVLWQIQDQRLIKTQRTGFTTPIQQTALPDNVGSFPIYLPAASCQQWVLRWSWVDNSFRKAYSKPTAFALWSDSLAKLRATDAIWNRAEYPMTVAVIGILGFLVLYMSFQYLQYGDKAYGAYALYCLGFCLFYLVRRNYWFDYPFGYLKPWRHYLDPYLSLFPVMAYVYFYQHFLSISRERHPHIWRVLQVNKIYIAGLWLLFPILLLWLPVSDASRVYFWARDLFIVGAFYLVYLAFQLNTPLSKIFIAGTFALVFFSLLMVGTDTVRPLLANWGYELPALRFSFISNLQLGILLESVIFAYALSYRSRLILQEKERVERRLIINKDRLRRAKVSPYFTYHAIGAVQGLLKQQHTDTATAYLVKFAGLLRYVLSHLERPNSSLADELHLCRQYVDLEQLRRPGLDYHAHTDSQIDLHNTYVPSILLQSLLEYSLSKSMTTAGMERRKLRLSCQRMDKGLEIELTDNRAAPISGQDNSLEPIRQRLSSLPFEATLSEQPLREGSGRTSGIRLTLRLIQETVKQTES